MTSLLVSNLTSRRGLAQHSSETPSYKRGKEGEAFRELSGRVLESLDDNHLALRAAPFAKGKYVSHENKLPSSVEEGMPGPGATAGVVGVPCSSATDRRDSGAPGCFVPRLKTPLKSPRVQGGTLFSTNVAPQRGMKHSAENLLLGRGGAQRRGGSIAAASKTPLKSPLVQGGTVSSSNVAPQRGIENPPERQIERHLQEAQAAEKKKDYNRAVAAYQSILKIRPQWALIHQSLGVVYHLQSRFPEAIS